MTDLNRLVQLRYLKLEELDLYLQPGLAIMFHNLTRLESLNLNDCGILSLEEDLSRNLHSLRQLAVRIVEEFTVMESVAEPLISLRYTLFTDPHLYCSCDNAWLITWAQRQKQVQDILFQAGEVELTCKNANDIQNLEDNCTLDLGFVLFLCTSLALLLFMLVVLLHQLALFHIARGWPNPRYRYDAFVLYSRKDKCWVVEQLLLNLEERRPPFLCLCLHSRDFQLGKDIVENITTSLYASHHFLRSNWCSMELRLATLHLLVEHRDFLILEDIPHRQTSADHSLARMVKTRTYLDRPRHTTLQPAFWDHLWTKLAPPEPQPRL
eukprot:XP_013986837.1 PREDICTED: toll-like receptor 13 [Salmo salar]